MEVKLINESDKFDKNLIKQTMEELNLSYKEAVDLLLTMDDIRKGNQKVTPLKLRDEW